MIDVTELTERISDQLLDKDFVRWSNEEIIRWINDAASEIVIRRPPAGTKTETLVLEEGARQELPDAAFQLIDVVRNISAQTKYPIQRVSRHELESHASTWYDDEHADHVQNYSYDDRQPKVFYVWPQVTAGTEVEVVYTRPPATITADTDQLDIGKEYMGPIVSYVLYRCFSKDAENNDINLATAHYTAFNESLGANTAMQLTVSPSASEA